MLLLDKYSDNKENIVNAINTSHTIVLLETFHHIIYQACLTYSSGVEVMMTLYNNNEFPAKYWELVELWKNFSELKGSEKAKIAQKVARSKHN